MSTFTAGSLADGQLETSETVIYTVPAATVAYLKTLLLFNTNAATQTIILWIKRSGGTARKWRQISLAQNESADALEGTNLQLSAGDSVEGSTTTGAAVDYTITGVVEA